MTERNPLPRVAILALPEATASVVYGMLDMFCSAGRDWRLVTDGEPGPPAVSAEIVAKVAEPLEVANGALVRPHRGLSSTPYDIVCIPELSIAPQADFDLMKPRTGPEPVTAKLSVPVGDGPGEMDDLPKKFKDSDIRLHLKSGANATEGSHVIIDGKLSVIPGDPKTPSAPKSCYVKVEWVSAS